MTINGNIEIHCNFDMTTRVFWYQNTACFHLVFPPDQNSRHHLLPGHFMNYQWVWEIHLNTTIRLSSLLTLISGDAFQNWNCKHSRKQRTSLSAVCVPTGLLNYIKHWNARSSKKVFSKKAKYRLYNNFSPSNLYEKESFFIHYTLSSLFEKPCSEKCRLYSFLAKFFLNWITAATIYYEEEPGNSISMLKLERNTKIEKKKPHNSIF